MSKKDIDIPVDELLKRAQEWIEQGFLVFFKWTCEKCGARLTFPEPNKFYKYGKCDQCGHVTEIKKGGFMVLKVF